MSSRITRRKLNACGTEIRKRSQLPRHSSILVLFLKGFDEVDLAGRERIGITDHLDDECEEGRKDRNYINCSENHHQHKCCNLMINKST